MIKFPFQKRLVFAPVPQEDDELIRAIADDPNRQDDTWQLNEEVNPDAMNRFWDEALGDIDSQSDFVE